MVILGSEKCTLLCRKITEREMLTLIKISDTDQGSLHSDLKIGLKLLLEFYLDLT